jgi:hypothetical protein
MKVFFTVCQARALALQDKRFCLLLCSLEKGPAIPSGALPSGFAAPLVVELIL